MSTRDVAGAYNAIATSYDRQLAGDEWMRRILWSRYARLFRSGERVLDVGCGTGTDALFIAGRGIRVVGIDVSPGMVGVLQEKAGEAHVGNLVETRVMDLADIGSLEPAGFDGIVSAFAGLSTTPDLGPFAADAARLLRPGGRVVLHMLNRTSLWEWLGCARRGDWVAARQLGKVAERDFTIGGRQVRHYMRRPAETYRRFFRSCFELRQTFSLGSLRPPHTVKRVPRPLAETLGAVERVAGGWPPLLNWGRFFVLEMVRRESAAL